MKILEIGIVKSKGKIAKIFKELTENESFESIIYEKPHEYIGYYWERYMKSKHQDNHFNQEIFKLIFYTLLYREGILPFYTQAKVAFVPNIEFDTILYSKERPVCLSLKTSLRERYKQADLEAIALKYVHRKAQSYLLTLDAREAKATKAKIPEGLLIGLDDVIDCNTKQIDELVTKLKRMKFCESTKIDVVTGNLVKQALTSGSTKICGQP